MSKDRDVVKRFFLEALATSLIRHPGIVEVFDYDVEPNGRAGLLGGVVGGTCDGMGRCSTVAGLCLL